MYLFGIFISSYKSKISFLEKLEILVNFIFPHVTYKKGP